MHRWIVLQVLNSQGVSSAVLPMDGFHYYRKELDAMPNWQEAHAKRGSHWTFNSQRLLEVIRTIKRVGHGRAPSFDHAHGDPVEDDIIIETSHKVVLVEGNYLLLPETPWNELRDLFDSRWLLLVRVCKRVCKRVHVYVSVSLRESIEKTKN